MSSRRSTRAKHPVKYTSASDGSDFEVDAKKPLRKSTKATTPKKRKKTTQDAAITDKKSPSQSASPKRAKKSTETLAVDEHRAKAAAAAAADLKAARTAHKKTWEAWIEANRLPAGDAAADLLLPAEPARAESITQTDAGRKYGLKKEELVVLRHYEKRNPLRGNTMRLYFEAEVRVLGFRKLGVLEGVRGGDDEVVRRGEEIWRDEHQDASEADTEQKDSRNGAAKPTNTKPKTPKQKWTAYIEAHTLSTPAALKEEPAEAINQSDCKPKYDLLPADLAVLPYFGKPNPKYGNTTKLFDESEVETLAYRKAAVVGGVEESEEGKLLEKGRELLEEKLETKAAK